MELNATEFRRRMLSLLDNMPDEGITVTKHGQPVARVLPVRKSRRGRYVTVPLLAGKGAPGPLCPTTETPYDLIFD